MYKRNAFFYLQVSKGEGDAMNGGLGYAVFFSLILKNLEHH